MRWYAILPGLLASALGAAVPGCRPRDGAEREASSPHTAITLELSSCYGRCAAYKLTLHEDGLVEYEGKYDVATRGRRTSHIAPSAFALLVEQFDAIHYATLTWQHKCREKYASDDATAYTSLTRYGKTVAIEHYLGDGCAPRELRTLERAIVAAVGTQLAEWTICDGRCPR